MTQSSRPRRRTGNWIVIAILLAASLVGVLWVPFYARITPTLGGFPFFYWYQLMWVVITAVLMIVAFQAVKRDNAARQGRPSSSGAAPGDLDGGAGGEE
jgi:Na+/melibiose symporter-like transporter